MYNRFLKRPLDAALSFVALILLLLPMLLIALAIWVDSGRPIIFRQKRVGCGKTHFQILKFRTMQTQAPSDVPTNDFVGAVSYITPVGRFLRRTSLDELMQLVNVLKGDMALVGPRPALWNQYDLIAARDAVGANAVRPGVTGLAQVTGRDEISIAEKARLDGQYVGHITFLGDVSLLCRTLGAVFRADGYAEGGRR